MEREIETEIERYRESRHFQIFLILTKVPHWPVIKDKDGERESRHFQIFLILTKVPHWPVIKDKDGERERVDTFKYFLS